jgi:L-alanine-DL-glutamate epimerase-like enolase superfamily enzyme
VQNHSKIIRARVHALRFPTETPEADGTFAWNSTTMILVEVEACGKTGLGYTYGHECVAQLTDDLLRRIVIGQNPFEIEKIWGNLVQSERNLGRVGLGGMSISAIDTALWDLKAKIFGVPLVCLLGGVRRQVPVYGSGGFTSYSTQEVIDQLQSWVGMGISRVKMKIGLGVRTDEERVTAVSQAIGNSAALFVDANEAYQPREALTLACALADLGVSWFEQPIQAEDLAGMRFLREKFPATLPLTTGEYLSDPAAFREVLLAGAADILQPDVTRCRGVTGFLKAAALCESFNIPISSHCAPSLHLPLGCAVPNLVHMEYFFDHVRIENLIFDHSLELKEGSLVPDLGRDGFGLELKRSELGKHVA